jgi:hypothetical protein
VELRVLWSVEDGCSASHAPPCAVPSYTQHAVAPTTRPPVSKPKGRTPKGADGTPCDWDERDGCWRESDGTPFDPKRAAARKKTRQRGAQSEASKRAEREAQAAAQQARRDGLTAAEKRAEREAQAAAHRKTRGVTPLKKALMLPPGPREQQMLFDTHGSGSAFSTVNSRRLRTLEEGSALHAECVEDTANDLKLLCPVDVLDQYRMVKAFVERKEEAEKLHVCGTCGALLSSKHARCPLESP